MTLLLMVAIEAIDSHLSEPGMDIASLFPGYDIFRDWVAVLSVVLMLVVISLCIYNWLYKIKFKHSKASEPAEQTNPLLGVAKEHEQQIIEMLKSVAKPEPGSNKLNRANTIHFLRTLKELELFDMHIDGQHQKAWIEQVTGYEEKSLSAFNQALDKQKENPKLAAEYRKQIEQIIAE